MLASISNEVEVLSPMTILISNEIAYAMHTLGAKSDLLSIIGSWGDTLPSDQILNMLKEWNADNKR
ncbi:hypothetical protein [Mucilaginibacter aquaedulcis]|uniref:hypothetical protein n=1 Tax=Mucilaginibacter aquaedulcis TaxID=1187081 RepID=UPI0025B3562E|nr:hypothetical protein [Mucilaginibacter aquaedulcis]MDN3551485.1 hypothetical protein [Mucilaginibacter aquaedulcis]